jgi:hypothetical protein
MTRKSCYICSSSKFMDNHHYDCLEGKLSPETVSLCRRCHRTYHDWGVGTFSPDTTERALEVENKRREILRALPHDHPLYIKACAQYGPNIPPMRLEDVKRSGYWYKKHGIPRPHLGRRKVPVAVPFKIPNGIPLCGEDWLKEHLTDHTPDEIAAQTIEIACDGKWVPPVSLGDKKGAVKALVRGLRK